MFVALLFFSLAMSVTVEQFRKDGWNLTEEGLDLLKEWSELEEPTYEQCLTVALNVSSTQLPFSRREPGI